MDEKEMIEKLARKVVYTDIMTIALLTLLNQKGVNDEEAIEFARKFMASVPQGEFNALKNSLLSTIAEDVSNA